MLRDYQQQAVDSIFTFFRMNREGNPLVVEPTGTGKSHVIAGFIEQSMQQWPQTRVMILTHVKELIAQNSAKLKEAWPTAPLGVYSAGLHRRDTTAPIIVGGVQSVANCADKFGHRDLLIIDECHLLSPNGESRYAQVIDSLRERNPYLRVIGLSATPYRLGQGHLCDGGLFTHVCCNQADIRWFDFFIDRGYLVPVIPKKTDVEVDLAGVAKQGGDYAVGQLQKAVDVDDLTQSAVQTMLRDGVGRTRGLVFSSGVQHAKHIAEYAQSQGIAAYPIYGELKKIDRDKLIAWFRDPSREVRWLVNNNVLTTGFDHPPIDLIGMLRPTTSPSLWVQMVGRGMRPSPATGKKDCLVLDFAGNTRRLGPVNDPVLPRKRGQGGDGAPPIKLCPECECYNHTTARVCYFCGFEFPIAPRLTEDASGLALLATNMEDISIDRIIKAPHHKKGKPVSLRVTYWSGVRKFEEWQCFEHSGYPRTLAEKWWTQRAATECPGTVAEVIDRWKELAQPRTIRIWAGEEHPRVVDYLF